jgi:hypothetical protein
MTVERTTIYPHCPATIRAIHMGGLTSQALQDELLRHGVALNDAARMIFASDHFTTSAARSVVTTVELRVRDLGHWQGATTAAVFETARRLGLLLCPLELAPHFRLQYLDQPEGYVGQPVWQQRAPPGSITVASEEFAPRGDFPNGFYIRRIEGTLWLRGYHAGPDHVWDPEDRMLFRKA